MTSFSRTRSILFSVGLTTGLWLFLNSFAEDAVTSSSRFYVRWLNVRVTKYPVTKCPCDEKSVWRNILWRNVRWLNVRVTKYPVTKCPCNEMSVWLNVLWRYVLWRNVRVTECPCDGMFCDQMSLWHIVRVTKCPCDQMVVTKCPVTKCPSAAGQRVLETTKPH